MTNRPTGPGADEVPEADWAEQHLDLDAENEADPLSDPVGRGSLSPEAAEADALEQLSEVQLEDEN